MINVALLAVGYAHGLCYAGTAELAIRLAIGALVVVSNVDTRFPGTSIVNEIARSVWLVIVH